jgi:histidine triad (HIT) family protein
MNPSEEPSVFTKIINREITADIVHETDSVIIIKTIAPRAAVHLLAIPKHPYRSITELSEQGDPQILWELFQAINHVVHATGIAESGYRLTTNSGENGRQEVPHLHFHITGGEKLPK